MRHHFGWEDAEGRSTESGGGKLLRPALCLLCAEAVGGDAADALPAAVAIELLHNFSLIHDDIEDQSDTRHGRPTLWRVAGVAHAINAGDGMFVLAQRTLLDLPLPPDRVVKAAVLFNEACVRLCEGQYLDLGFESRSSVTPAEYEEMIGGKSAALIAASMAIGALCGRADDATVDAFARCGHLLGLAFQIQDDVLGAWGDPALTGKPSGDDIRSRKKAFPAVHALATLSGKDLDELQRLYALSGLGDADVAMALRLFEAAGSREAATSTARAYAAQGLDELGPLELTPGRREEIEAIAGFFVEREA
jgi:geranylgeranyl diphosphate synthase type I